ncbi:MAG: exodeoxyribonuclease VII small subunit [Pirellulales bacterium]
MAKQQPTPGVEAPLPSFEGCLEQLAEIVESLESGDLGLNDALGQYEQGIQLLKQCHLQLEKAERRIELLSGFDAEGNPVTEAIEDESSLQRSERQAPKSRRPQAQKAPNRKSGQSADVDDGDSLF